MRRPRAKRAALGLTLVLGGCGGGASPPTPSPTPTATPVPRLELVAVRPLPPSVQALDREARQLREAGRLEELAAMYPRLLEGLRAEWGEWGRDLAPYHVNYCLVLNQSGQPDQALAAIDQALVHWPWSLQHRILAGLTRLERGRAQGRQLPGTDEAMRVLLDPINLPLLRDQGLKPVGMALEWANLLLAVGLGQEALAALDLALAVEPDAAPALALKAETLVNLHRSAEALPLLKRLALQGGGARVSARLGEALLDAGQAEEAWKVLEPLLGTAGLEPAVLRHARLQGGATLNRLRRFAEARDLLLAHLRGAPDDYEALHQLATALNGLGRTEVGEALVRRTAELAPYRSDREDAIAARRAGRAATAGFLDANAWLVLDRTGDALQALAAGQQADPTVEDLWILDCEIRLQLGRLDRVVAQARLAATRHPSPLLDLNLARLLARAGRRDEAMAIVEQTRTLAPGGARPAALLRAHQIRVLRELDRHQELAAFVAATAADTVEGAERFDQVPDLALLGRAELLLAAGDAAGARAILGQSFRLFPGSEVWARALAGLAGEARAMGDPSDLVDHPELVRRAGDLVPAPSPELAALLATARALAAERERVCRGMGERDDREVAGSWRRLLGRYLEAGARRKARELAWFLWSFAPGGVEEERWLARSLARPEELVARLAAAERGLLASPDDEELLRLAAEARQAMGIGP